MTDNDKIQFKVALQNGLGFAASCEINQLSPKETSVYLNANPTFKLECVQAIKAAARGNLEYAAKLKIEKKFDQWQRQQDYMVMFVTQLVLWEDYCKKKDLTPQVLIKAVMIYQTANDCATAVGLTHIELVEYIADNADLSEHIFTIKKHFF